MGSSPTIRTDVHVYHSGMSKTSDFYRLGVNLDSESKKSLDGIGELKSWNPTETVRRSLSVMHYLVKEIAAGRRVVTMDADGKNPRDVVFL